MGQQDQHAEDGSDGGGQGRAADAHVQGIHEHIVQDDIGDGAGGQSDHGQLRPPVIPGQAAEQEAQDQEGAAGDDVPHILNGLGMDLGRGAQQLRQGVNEEITEYHDENAHSAGADHGDVEYLHCLFLLVPPQVAGDQHTGARGHCHGQRNQNFDQGHGDSGRRHGVRAKAVPDEDAVHDHVDGVEQQTDHLRDGVFCEKRMGLTLVHRDQSSLKIRKGQRFV